jgi:hypothetical protein
MDNQEHAFHQSPDSQGQSDNTPPQQTHTVSPNTSAGRAGATSSNGRFRYPLGCLSTLLVFSISVGMLGIGGLFWFNKFPPFFFSSFLSLHIDRSALPNLYLSQSLPPVLNTMLTMIWIGVSVSVWLGVIILLVWGFLKQQAWAFLGFVGIGSNRLTFFASFLGLHVDQSLLSGLHLSQSLSPMLDATLVIIWIGVIALLTWGLWKQKLWALWSARVVILYLVLRLWIYSITWYYQNAPHLGDKWIDATVLAIFTLFLSAGLLFGLVRSIYLDFTRYKKGPFMRGG